MTEQGDAQLVLRPDAFLWLWQAVKTWWGSVILWLNVVCEAVVCVCVPHWLTPAAPVRSICGSLWKASVVRDGAGSNRAAQIKAEDSLMNTWWDYWWNSVNFSVMAYLTFLLLFLLSLSRSLDDGFEWHRFCLFSPDGEKRKKKNSPSDRFSVRKSPWPA